MGRSAADGVGRRQRLGRAIAEIHYRLRTEGDSPGRTAAAVALGTFIACLPLYGLQLLLCIAFARWLRLSRLTTCLAAHVNNPLTAPGLLVLGFAIGHGLRAGSWPALSLEQLRSLTLWVAGRDLLLGSAVLGLLLATALGLLSYVISRRWRRSNVTLRLYEETSHLYLDSGIFHWEFVHAKLKHDPLYGALLTSAALPAEGTLVDLGCGRAIAPALLLTAMRFHRGGTWEPDWPAPPRRLTVIGVEQRPPLAQVARAALGEQARIEVQDLRVHDPEPCDVVLLLDVLHYLEPGHQLALIRRVARALRPGGVVLLREADAAAGLRFFVTRCGERLCAIARRDRSQVFTYRTAADWCGVLRAEGLRPTVSAMWAGTPFGNVMIVARKPDGASLGPDGAGASAGP
jgi:uncharacterized protein (DUF2062 family)